ncbi:hypothetical protein BHM03_00051573, partial [Ensete ventricosum]
WPPRASHGRSGCPSSSPAIVFSGTGERVRDDSVVLLSPATPKMTLPGRNFLIPVDDDMATFCFAFAPSSSGLSIIGNIQQEGIQITFDAPNGFIRREAIDINIGDYAAKPWRKGDETKPESGRWAEQRFLSRDQNGRLWLRQQDPPQIVPGGDAV